MGFPQLALFGLAVFASTSTCHKIGDHPSLNDRLAHGSLYSKWATPIFDTAEDTTDLHDKRLTKKSLYNLAGNNPSDESILAQGFLDLQTLVTYVAGNPNAQVLARYFDPNDANDVNAIFNTVMQMASTNPPRNPPGARANLAPTDLHSISVTRAGGGFGTLAESFNYGALNTHQQIKVYNFGWTALWQRLLQNIDCSMIGPKTNYKMHFLGSLLLHETLHFHNVPILAWNQYVDSVRMIQLSTSANIACRILQPDQVLDDQPGSFACLSKAYGPCM